MILQSPKNLISVNFSKMESRNIKTEFGKKNRNIFGHRSLNEARGPDVVGSLAMGLIHRDRDRKAPAPPGAWTFSTTKTIQELVNSSAAPLHQPETSARFISFKWLQLNTTLHSSSTEETWAFTQSRLFLGWGEEKKRAELLSINTDHLSSRSKEPIIFPMGPHIFSLGKHIYILKYMIQRNHIFIIYKLYT